MPEPGKRIRVIRQPVHISNSESALHTGRLFVELGDTYIHDRAVGNGFPRVPINHIFHVEPSTLREAFHCTAKESRTLWVTIEYFINRKRGIVR